MKIRKKGTRFVEIFESEPQHAGIFIDVYPLENVPNFAPWRWFHGAISNFLHLCCSCVRMRAKKERYFAFFDDPAVHKAVKIKSVLGKCLGFVSLKRWCRMTDRFAASCKKQNTRWVTFPSGGKHYFGEMLERASVFPLQQIEFAGKVFPMMADPTTHLSLLYGDYMKIPPADQQIRHTILELELGEEHV